MNIERGPRKQRGFVIIDNALAQNCRLSFGARGLAEYLLSLPPGSRVDIRTLAAENPEGRDAIASYMRELEGAYYLVRTSDRGERGRFVTKTTMHEEPQDPASLPKSLAKPWSKAKKRPAAPLTLVPVEATDGEFSQVGPNPASPDFGGPNFGGPDPGRPDAGETGSNPYGVKGPGERTSSSPVREVDQVADGTQPGGGGGEAPHQQKTDPHAVAFVDALPYSGRLPGPRQRTHLIQRVEAAFGEGWQENALRRQLTEETGTAKSLAAVYRHRLDPENLPAPPAVPTPRSASETPTRACCPECHRPLRNSTEDALCRDCREEAC